jgi:hypothetical protein
MRFIVLGGGCYGTFYARQLMSAHTAGALAVEAVVIVDRAENCQARTLQGSQLIYDVRDWDDFFDAYFSDATPDIPDHVVPPPFTPHLSLAWLLRTLRRDLPVVHWSLEPFRALPGTPFQQQSEGGPLIVSHADWICPVHCIEPGTCPHTRGARFWDLERTVDSLVLPLAEAGQAVEQVHLFRCLHLAYGVGTFPASAIVRARQQIRAAATHAGEHRFVVGTVSHCHGALNLLTARNGTETVMNVRLSRADPAGVPPTSSIKP